MGNGGGPWGKTAPGLPQLVREIRVSSVHEGFAFPRAQLTRGELKLLRQLCQAYGLQLRLTAEKATARRLLGVSSGGGLSPGLRPAAPSPSATPSWAPLTPAPLRPMDFKGIRHWKEIRGQTNMLGIVRPLGPEDGLPSFAAGRGRPV
ncbi:unnamed protein product [Phytomonas sp. Hart1]|nr:unnamed protein product [Phytomonas sp. Hart1]|eukprot:CCW66012.1 unnamed protein product [Phytomonas sp. isolate Hart1]